MAGAFNGITQYINTGNWNPPAVDEFTWMCWLRPQAPIGTDGRPFARGTSPNFGGEEEFAIIVDDTSITTYNPRIFLRSVTSNVNLISATVLNTGNWHHIAGVYRSSLSNIRIFLDAVLDTTGGSITGNVRQGSVPTWIGNRPDRDDERPFEGRVEDPRVYSRALGVAELQTIVTSLGADNIVDGLIGRWPLRDHAAGVVAGSATDVSGSGFSGAGVNAPTFEEGILRGSRRRRR